MGCVGCVRRVQVGGQQEQVRGGSKLMTRKFTTVQQQTRPTDTSRRPSSEHRGGLICLGRGYEAPETADDSSTKAMNRRQDDCCRRTQSAAEQG